MGSFLFDLIVYWS